MAEKPRSKYTVGICKYEEPPVVTLPGCKVYSVRMRPSNRPKNDIDYDNWNIVGYNIEKNSRRCNLTATGDTLDDAVDAMQRMLDLAKQYRINTFNGVPGSGLGKGKHDTPDPSEDKYTISEIPFYKVNVSVGPWKPKQAKGKGGHNNNCGRHQAKREMRNIVVAIELKQIREVKEESRG